MIRYTVLWSDAAENELAALWCNYPDRPDITQAADRIDAELRDDAHQKGLLIPKNVRVLSHRPLTIYFRVDQADRKVLVEGVQLTEVN